MPFLVSYDDPGLAVNAAVNAGNFEANRQSQAQGLQQAQFAAQQQHQQAQLQQQAAAERDNNAYRYAALDANNGRYQLGQQGQDARLQQRVQGQLGVANVNADARRYASDNSYDLGQDRVGLGYDALGQRRDAAAANDERGYYNINTRSADAGANRDQQAQISAQKLQEAQQRAQQLESYQGHILELRQQALAQSGDGADFHQGDRQVTTAISSATAQLRAAHQQAQQEFQANQQVSPATDAAIHQAETGLNAATQQAAQFYQSRPQRQPAQPQSYAPIAPYLPGEGEEYFNHRIAPDNAVMPAATNGGNFGGSPRSDATPAAPRPMPGYDPGRAVTPYAPPPGATMAPNAAAGKADAGPNPYASSLASTLPRPDFAGDRPEPGEIHALLDQTGNDPAAARALASQLGFSV